MYDYCNNFIEDLLSLYSQSQPALKKKKKGCLNMG